MREPDDAVFRAFRRRWHLPCTALVLLFLLYNVGIWILLHDRLRVDALYSIELLEADGSASLDSRYFLWEVPVILLILAMVPDFRDSWSHDGRRFPQSPRWKRRAVIGAYLGWVLVGALVLAYRLSAPPPYALWMFFLPRIYLCLYYFYLCAVTNYPFGRRAIREDDG